MLAAPVGKFFVLVLAAAALATGSASALEPRRRADLAYELGFYSIAEDGYRALLDPTDPVPWERSLAIALARGNRDLAGDLEANFLQGGPRETARLRLLRYLLSTLREDPRGELLAGIGEEELTPGDAAWFFAAASLEAERQDLPARAQELWQRALELADGDVLRADLEEFHLHAALILQPPAPALEERLKGRWRSYGWKAEGIPAAKKYALLLHRLGRTEEGLAVLDQQLAHLPQPTREQAAGIHLLQFLLRPAEGDGVPERLAKILEEEEISPQGEMALRLLLSWATTPDRRGALADFLERRTAEEELPLRARLQLALQMEKWRQAGDLALRLLALPLGDGDRDALRQLWLSLVLEKNFSDFSDLVAGLGGSQHPMRHSLLLALANHFYRYGDVPLAAKFLDEWGKTASDAVDRDAIPLRIRVALALGRWPDAVALFRKLSPDRALPLLAEANEKLMASGLADVWNGWLLEVHSAVLCPLPPLARLRWSYFLVQNALTLRRTGDAAQLLREMQSQGEVWENFFRERGADLTLLALRVAMATEDGPEAERERAALRSRWPDSPEARESYFLRAGDWARAGQLDLAAEEMQNYLERCRPEGDRGDGGRIAEALLLLASLQAGGGSLHAALGTLEELWQGHPHSAYACRARLRQGDLLRSLHQFEAAALVYRSLLQRPSPGVETPFAELALAKCQLALASDAETAALQSALAILEKLSATGGDDPNFFLEVAYTHSLALRRSGDLRRSRQLLWQLWQDHALVPEALSRLDGGGKFWLHAVGRDLLATLDPSLDDRAMGQMLRELDES
jgi:hypothetical protein